MVKVSKRWNGQGIDPWTHAALETSRSATDHRAFSVSNNSCFLVIGMENGALLQLQREPDSASIAPVPAFELASPWAEQNCDQTPVSNFSFIVSAFCAIRQRIDRGAPGISWHSCHTASCEGHGGGSGGFHGSKTGLANKPDFTAFVYVFTRVDFLWTTGQLVPYWRTVSHTHICG